MSASCAPHWRRTSGRSREFAARNPGVDTVVGRGTSDERSGMNTLGGTRHLRGSAGLVAINGNALRSIVAGATVAVMSVVGGLLPFTGVMQPPEGLDPFNVVGVVEKGLWTAVAAIAAARPATAR